MTNFDPRGMAGRIRVGNGGGGTRHCAIFMGVFDPQSGASLDHTGLIGRIYAGDH